MYAPGGPEVLKVEERPVPTPQSGEVLIRVHAAGMNRSELFTRQGMCLLLPPSTERDSDLARSFAERKVPPGPRYRSYRRSRLVPRQNISRGHKSLHMYGRTRERTRWRIRRIYGRENKERRADTGYYFTLESAWSYTRDDSDCVGIVTYGLEDQVWGQAIDSRRDNFGVCPFSALRTSFVDDHELTITVVWPQLA